MNLRPALLVLLLAAPASAAMDMFPWAARSCPIDKKQMVQRIVNCRENVPLAECRRLAENSSCGVVRELATINAVVIRMPRDQAPVAEARLAAAAQVESVEDDQRVNWLRSSGGSLLPVKDVDFKLPPIGEIVRPWTPTPKPAAGDPEQPWGIRRVNAAALWSKTQGRGVKVAIIDTGIDRNHPDLKANVAGGVNVADAAKSGDFSDDQGHGTHVAGTVGAARDSKGVVGVAPQVSLYGVKVLDADGNGSYSEIIAGIEWAVKNKMDVANMSLGAAEGTAALAKAVKAAARAGLVIVAAAGNDSGGPVSYPAVYPEVIAVSSSDKYDKLSDFSSVGPEVDVIGPGSDVLSSVPGGGYSEFSGTSMACPHMAGVAALAVATGARGVSAVKAALQAAASPLPGLSGSQQGAGLPNAAKLGGGSPRGGGFLVAAAE